LEAKYEKDGWDFVDGTLVLPELLSMGPCNTLVGFHQLHRLCFGWKRLKKFGVVFL